VCSIGFEPNEAHTLYLKRLNAYFARKNRQAVIVYEYAVSSRRGNATFYRDTKSAKRHDEWGASLSSFNKRRKNDTIVVQNVQLVNLSEFVNSVVYPILLQEKERNGKFPKVFMKLDIEGAEYEVFPAMAVSGGLCLMDLIFIEWHGEGARRKLPGHVDMKTSELISSFNKLKATYPNCKVEIAPLDDESYVDGTQIPLDE
jgi:FkbM family methyltransferase